MSLAMESSHLLSSHRTKRSAGKTHISMASPSVFKVLGSLKCKSSDFTTHYLPCCHLQSCLTPPSFIDDFSTWLTVFLPIASPVTLGDFDILGDGPSPTPSYLHSLSRAEPMVLFLVCHLIHQLLQSGSVAFHPVLSNCCMSLGMSSVL